MSRWFESKKEDLSLSLDAKEIDVFIEQDNQGSVYTSIPIKDMLEFLKEEGYKITR